MTSAARPVAPEHTFDESEQSVWSWLEYGDLDAGDALATRPAHFAGPSAGSWDDDFMWDLAV